MKLPTLNQIAVLAALTVALQAAPAFATYVPAYTVSGTVTSVAGGGQIVIDGKSYSVQLQGPALRQLQQVHVGQVVDVILNGPPGAAATQVVAIHVHNAS